MCSNGLRWALIEPQCGNFEDFYVKSILENLEILKLPLFPFYGSEFCSFGKFQPSKSAKIHKKSKLTVSKCVNLTDFEPLNSATLIVIAAIWVQSTIVIVHVFFAIPPAMVVIGLHARHHHHHQWQTICSSLRRREAKKLHCMTR